MTTPTPRTDAAIIRDKMILTEVGLLEIVDAGTARQLERDLAASQEENAKLKAEITRVMQAAANGAYCRRNHAKCECENIAESIRTDE